MNPDSYYLANLAAEAYLKDGDVNKARKCFREAKKILKNLPSDEKNIWIFATYANACLALGEFENVRDYIEKIKKECPTPDEKSIIKNGLIRIAEGFSLKIELNDLLAIIG